MSQNSRPYETLIPVTLLAYLNVKHNVMWLFTVLKIHVIQVRQQTCGAGTKPSHSRIMMIATHAISREGVRI